MEKSASILEQLACSTGRRDEQPNIELAEKIAARNDKAAVAELAAGLLMKGKDIPNDCIKTLYEIGARKPELISEEYKMFIALLTSKNNRMAWGAMTAVHYIAGVIPEKIYGELDKVLDAADKGSVISKDHAMGVLVELCALKGRKQDMLVLLLDRLRGAADNQFAMYAEMTAGVVDENNKAQFGDILRQRMTELPKESQQKRVAKLLKKIV